MEIYIATLKQARKYKYIIFIIIAFYDKKILVASVLNKIYI